MYCKKCGAALPSEGYVCKSCGAMMDHEQIKNQKEFQKNQKKEINLLSDRYSKEPIIREYKSPKENKFLGALLIILIIIILIIVALLKVM